MTYSWYYYTGICLEGLWIATKPSVTIADALAVI
jgi:hypothetical protein